MWQAKEKSVDQAEPTQKRTEMQELINKQQIAERKQDNLPQRIQQVRDSRTPAQQDPSTGAQQNATAGAQQNVSTGVQQNPSASASNAPQAGQTTAATRTDARPQQQNVSFGPIAENNPQPTSARIDAKKSIAVQKPPPVT